MIGKSICIGQIGRANGIKGHVRVKSFTGDAGALADYGPLHDKSGQKSFNIMTLRIVKSDLVTVKFNGIDSRTEAEKLNGIELFITRDQLPEIEGTEDFYISDLMGLEAVTLAGKNIGQVVNVTNFGAGDLLEIKPNKGSTLLVPFTKKAVPQIDIMANMVQIDENLAGIFDELRDRAGDL